MSQPKIVTFSGQARHGKDTAAQKLMEQLHTRGKKAVAINYTDYLKYTAAQYLGWDGQKDEKGRSFLQFLGCEKVAHEPTFWVDTVIRTVKIIGGEFDYVLIGDCRFRHDIARWQEEGYEVVPIHVTRLGFDNGLTDAQKGHPSENDLQGYPFAQYVRAADLDDLEKEVMEKVLPLM